MRRTGAADGPAGAVVDAQRRRVAAAVVFGAAADQLASRLTAALVTGGTGAAGVAVVGARREGIARIVRGAEVLRHAPASPVAVARGSLGALAALVPILGRRQVGAQNLSERAGVARVRRARVDVDAFPVSIRGGPRRAGAALGDAVVVRVGALDLRVAAPVLDEARVERAPGGSDAVARGSRRALTALEAVGAGGRLEILAVHPGVARTLGAGVDVHAASLAVTLVPSRARAAGGPAAAVGTRRQRVAAAVLDRAAGFLDALGLSATLVSRRARAARETPGAVDAIGALVATAVGFRALVDVLAPARLCLCKSIRALAALVPTHGVDALDPRVAPSVVHGALVRVSACDAVVRGRVPVGALAAHHPRGHARIRLASDERVATAVIRLARVRRLLHQLVALPRREHDSLAGRAHARVTIQRSARADPGGGGSQGDRAEVGAELVSERLEQRAGAEASADDVRRLIELSLLDGEAGDDDERVRSRVSLLDVGRRSRVSHACAHACASWIVEQLNRPDVDTRDLAHRDPDQLFLGIRE